MSEENKSLVELVDESQQILNALIETGGEINEDLEKRLAEIELKLPQKIDGYAAVLDRLENEMDYWKSKAAAYNKIASGCVNARERIKNALKSAIIATGKDEIKGIDSRFKLSNSKPRLVLDETKIPPAYFMHVTTTVVDKKKIEEDLKIGVPVEGALFEEVKSIRSYANTKGGK